MRKKTKTSSVQPQTKRWLVAGGILLGLFMAAMIFSWIIEWFVAPDSMVLGGEDDTLVAIIEVNGIISSGEMSLPGLSQSGADPDTVSELIELAEDDPLIEAIVIEINSPGGTPVASAEIADVVYDSSLPTVAWIRDIGASGAYWVASSADHVIAHRMSIVGSVGVRSSYLVFTGLLEKYGIEYNRLVAGDLKDIGSPFKDMTTLERELYQGQIDDLHEMFLDEVVERRNLTNQQKEKIKDAMFFLGAQALPLGLIDEIGSENEVEEYLKRELNATELNFVQFQKKKSLFDLLTSVVSRTGFHVGKGIGYEVMSSALKQSSVSYQSVMLT